VIVLRAPSGVQQPLLITNKSDWLGEQVWHGRGLPMAKRHWTCWWRARGDGASIRPPTVHQAFASSCRHVPPQASQRDHLEPNGLTTSYTTQEEEEEASETVSPYATPSTLYWRSKVMPHLTDDDYQPVECTQVLPFTSSDHASGQNLTNHLARQNANQTLFVPAGWWMSSLNVARSPEAVAVSLRSHYASPAQLDELCSTLPPPVLIRLKNRLWDGRQSAVVQKIDRCMGTPGRSDVVLVLQRILDAPCTPLQDSNDAHSVAAVHATTTAAELGAPNVLYPLDGDLTCIVEMPRHAHLNPVPTLCISLCLTPSYAC
jgi:hypothetical protein